MFIKIEITQLFPESGTSYNQLERDIFYDWGKVQVNPFYAIDKNDDLAQVLTDIQETLTEDYMTFLERHVTEEQYNTICNGNGSFIIIEVDKEYTRELVEECQRDCRTNGVSFEDLLTQYTNNSETEVDSDYDISVNGVYFSAKDTIKFLQWVECQNG